MLLCLGCTETPSLPRRFCSPPFLCELCSGQPHKRSWIRAPEPLFDPEQDSLCNVSHFTISRVWPHFVCISGKLHQMTSPGSWWDCCSLWVFLGWWEDTEVTLLSMAVALRQPVYLSAACPVVCRQWQNYWVQKKKRLLNKPHVSGEQLKCIQWRKSIGQVQG